MVLYTYWKKFKIPWVVDFFARKPCMHTLIHMHERSTYFPSKHKLVCNYTQPFLKLATPRLVYNCLRCIYHYVFWNWWHTIFLRLSVNLVTLIDLLMTRVKRGLIWIMSQINVKTLFSQSLNIVLLCGGQPLKNIFSFSSARCIRWSGFAMIRFFVVVSSTTCCCTVYVVQG